MPESIFNKFAGLGLNFVKFLRTLFFLEHPCWLLLNKMKNRAKWRKLQRIFFKSIFLSFKLIISGKIDHLNTCDSAVTWKITPSLWNDNLNPSELRRCRLCSIDIVLLFYCHEISCFFCVSFNATRLLLPLHNLSSQNYQKITKKRKSIKTNKQKKIGEMKKQFLDFHLTPVILSSKCYDLSTIRHTFLAKFQSYSNDVTRTVLLSASITNYSLRGTTWIYNNI